jgi:hypothetical protein
MTVAIRFFDVSKQVAGGGVLHTLNLVGSLISGRRLDEDQEGTNPCIW